MGNGYGGFGGASQPRTRKRSTAVDGMGIPAAKPVAKMKGAVMRSSGPGGMASMVGTAKSMSGPKTTKKAAKMGTQGITSQGQRQQGMSAGRPRVNRGRNNIGSGRAQSY